MITRERLADLQPGDVVEITWLEEGHSDVIRSIRGPVHRRGSNCLYVGAMTVIGPSGEPWGVNWRTLTVVSRAPRPLYVNHDRTEPVPGDVAQGGPDGNVYLCRPARGFSEPRWWFWDGELLTWNHGDPPDRLRLLVDGETGQVVTA